VCRAANLQAPSQQLYQPRRRVLSGADGRKLSSDGDDDGSRGCIARKTTTAAANDAMCRVTDWVS